MNKTLTILLNWNGKNDTLACLESLQQAGASILVVDNGSSDDSVRAIRERFPQISLLETGHNLGFAGGNNAGIQWGLQREFENFLILNNDTLVAPDLFEKFKEALTEYPSVGLFGAKIYLQSEPTRFDHLGGNWNYRKGQIDFVGMRAFDDGKSFEAPLQLDYVCGAALLVRRAVFEKIGLLDARYFLYWEENDFCFRARRAGFGVQVCPQAKIWHKVSASASKEGKPFQSYFYWRNYLLWLEKNCPWSERWIPYCQIAKTTCKLSLKMPFKQLKLILLRYFRPAFVNEKEKAIQRQSALLWGVKDYCLRRFGAGSSSRFKTKI